MAIDIVVLNDSSLRYIEESSIQKKYPHAVLIDTSSATALKQILNKTNTSQFWLVVGNLEDIQFNLMLEPDGYDKLFKVKKFNDNFYLVNRRFFSKNVSTKQISSIDDIFKCENEILDPVPTGNTTDCDIVFLSYDEPEAEHALQNIVKRFGDRVKHVHGVAGIVNAHFAAAAIADTENFFVVDADAIILKNFNFEYNMAENDPDFVKVWCSKNPVNGLIYGYGGVKLFNKQMFKNKPANIIDLTTSIASKGITVVNTISNITAFNATPLSTWRSAFRECAKLESRIIENQNNADTEYRLSVWTTIANGLNSEYSLSGARDGKQFGQENKNNPEALLLINDYEWLKNRFWSSFSL